jgi:hypothetical protein
VPFAARIRTEKSKTCYLPSIAMPMHDRCRHDHSANSDDLNVPHWPWPYTIHKLQWGQEYCKGRRKRPIWNDRSPKYPSPLLGPFFCRHFSFPDTLYTPWYIPGDSMQGLWDCWGHLFGDKPRLQRTRHGCRSRPGTNCTDVSLQHPGILHGIGELALQRKCQALVIS